MPAEAGAGQAAEPPGIGRDADDQITGAGGGLEARCLRVPGLGWRRARSEMPVGAEAGQAAGSERDADGPESGGIRT